MVPRAINKTKFINTVYEYENSLKFSSKLEIDVLPLPVMKNRNARSTGNSIWESNCMKTITGTKKNPMKTNIPNFHPLLPKCFSIVKVKSKSSPAALKQKYYVVNEIVNPRALNKTPNTNPLSLKAQGIVISPEPTIPFHTDKMVVKLPCLPVSLSISPLKRTVSTRFSSIIC